MVVAGLVGFVAYRICVEFMELGPATVVGFAVLGVSWLVTAPRGKSAD
jgi:hypothetical protein